MKNVKWELRSKSKEGEGGGVSRLVGDWGRFFSTPFKCTVYRWLQLLYASHLVFTYYHQNWLADWHLR